MELSIVGQASTNIYERGDTCLQIDPFDNYRLFTLYQDWRTEDRIPLDLSGDQDLYLVFRSKNKEIRIPEYDLSGSGITLDKVNGQALFKINQKNALDILSLDNRIFYITRVYYMMDAFKREMGGPSDEEVVYMGKWTDATSVADSLTSQIKALNKLLEDRNEDIRNLQKSNADLIEQNVQYATDLEDAKAKNDELEDKVNTLEAENAEFKSGDLYDGFVIGEGTHYKILSNEKCTEEELLNLLKDQEELVKN